MKLHRDNHVARLIVSNLAFHERMKHREVHKLIWGAVVTRFVSSNNQLVDVLVESPAGSLRGSRIQYARKN